MTKSEFPAWLAKLDKDEIEKIIKEIDTIIKLRNLSLISYEKCILEKLKSQEMSILNISSKKGKLIKIMREAANLQLQCRILRRNIFFLKYRKNLLISRLEIGDALPEADDNSSMENEEDNEQINAA